MEYLTQYAYAKLLGVNPSAITRAVQNGRIIKTKKGIDPNHPHNVYYEQNINRNRPHRKRVGNLKRKATKNGEDLKIRENKRDRRKKKKPLYASELEGEEKPKKKKKVNGNGSNVGVNLDDVKERASYGAVTETNIKALKVIEQIEQIRLRTQKERQLLVERDLVKRVFSKIYTIEVNELRIIGDTLAPEIASYFNSDDSEAILKTNQRIEKEIYKALNHIKRLISDYLKSVGSFFEDETEIDEDFLN